MSPAGAGEAVRAAGPRPAVGSRPLVDPSRCRHLGPARRGRGRRDLEYIAPSAGTACKLCWDASGRKALYKY